MTKPFTRKTEHWRVRRAKAGAAERWRRDKLRRLALAGLAPLDRSQLDPIVLRVIVIRREAMAMEAVIYESEAVREARRKIRALGLT